MQKTIKEAKQALRKQVRAELTHMEPGEQAAASAQERALLAAQALWKTAQQKLMAKVCGVPIYEQPQIWAHHDTLDYGFKLEGSLTLGPVINEVTHFTQ